MEEYDSIKIMDGRKHNKIYDSGNLKYKIKL